MMRSKLTLKILGRVSVLGSCVLLQFACNNPCPGDANQIYIEIRTSGSEQVSPLSSLQLTIEIDGATRSKTFELEDKLADGKTSLTVALPKSSKADKSKTLSVTILAFGESNLGGPPLASGDRSITVSDDECPTLPILLTSLEQNADGGMDAGQPDSGFDASPEDASTTDMGFMDAAPVDAGEQIDVGPPDTGVAQSYLGVSLMGTGAGRVISDPPGITCPGACAARFPIGTSVTLTSTPSPGSGFAGWGGACSGANECVITLTETSTNALAEFELGLVAFYALDNNTNDNSGHAHHGSNMGAVPASGYQGQSNTAYEFHEGDSVDVASAPELSGFSEFTVCAWFSLTSTRSGVDTYLVAKVYYDGQNGNDAYALYIRPNGRRVAFKVSTNMMGSHRNTAIFSDSTKLLNRWSHVCGVKIGLEIIIYLNGNRGDSREVHGTINQTISDLKLGRCEGIATGGDCTRNASLRGSLDNVKIYNRALSGAGVMAEYNRTCSSVSP